MALGPLGRIPDQLTDCKRRREGLGRQTPQHLSALIAAKRKYDCTCPVCGHRKHLSLDHVVPLARGGRNRIGNFQILCKRDNCAKGTKVRYWSPWPSHNFWSFDGRYPVAASALTEIAELLGGRA